MGLSIVLLSLAIGGISAKASPEGYPSRPISVIVPFPPGGVAELTARPLLAVMETILKQPIVVINKPGASGTVGTQQASISKPDGYTLS
jgi:tripartite-type tricarboxylate transporter receptor subunit TctC